MKFLKNIKIQLKNNSYPIIIGKNVLKNFNTFYSQYCKNSKKILFVSNAQIPTKYIKTIRAVFVPNNRKLFSNYSVWRKK